MAQNITIQGASYSAVPAVTLPKTGGGTASFFDVSDTTAAASDVASDKYFYTSAGVRTQGTNSGGGGSSKNVQVYVGYASKKASSYGATSVTLTCSKTGTYTISWTAWRSSSSGTMGTNCHIGSTAESSNHESWTGTYGQQVKLTGQSVSANQTVTIYATSGSTSRAVYVANLIIKEE